MISYTQACYAAPAMCVSVMHSTFIVDQYMALFYFCYILHGLHGHVQGYNISLHHIMVWRCFGWFLFGGSVHMLSFPSSLCNGESEYDWSLWLDFDSSNFIPLGQYVSSKIKNFCRDMSATHIHSNTYTYVCNTYT